MRCFSPLTRIRSSRSSRDEWERASQHQSFSPLTRIRSSRRPLRMQATGGGDTCFSPLTRIRSSRRRRLTNLAGQCRPRFQSPDEDSIIPELVLAPSQYAGAYMFQSPDEDSIIPEKWSGQQLGQQADEGFSPLTRIRSSRRTSTKTGMSCPLVSFSPLTRIRSSRSRCAAEAEGYRSDGFSPLTRIRSSRS